MAAAILAAMLSDLPFMKVDTTEHTQEWSFVALGEDEMMKSASFLPENFPYKKASFLGQNEEKLFWTECVFPAAPHCAC